MSSKPDSKSNSADDKRYLPKVIRTFKDVNRYVGSHSAKSNNHTDKTDSSSSVIRMGQRFILEDNAETKARSIDLFFHWIENLGKNTDSEATRERYYFRGEWNINKLLPSILRDNYAHLITQHDAKDTIHLQSKLLNRYKRYTQHLIHADGDYNAPIYDNFDILCMAQHWGLPTMLLDWTLNPYVAAYFAGSGITFNRINNYKYEITDSTSKYKPSSHYIRVWVMKLKKPTDRVMSTIHLEDRSRIDEYQKYLNEKPECPLIVVPLVFTRRISAQAGRFVYCGHSSLDRIKDSIAKPASPLDKYSIENENNFRLPWTQLYSLDIEFSSSNSERNKESTREDRNTNEILKYSKRFLSRLEFMGFHSGRLYPDLGGWATYLAEGHI